MKEIQIAIGSYYKPVTDHGGYAYHILTDDFEYYSSNCYYQTSSQRMEMRAFMEALKYVYSKYGMEACVTIFTKLESQINALRYNRYNGTNKDLYESTIDLPISIIKEIVHAKPADECYTLVNKLCALEEMKVPVRKDKPDEPTVTQLF
ncbi:MAG: hypothetical protein RIS20_2262 [Bacteroidota bacterium]|jgi:ribonuclease HI